MKLRFELLLLEPQATFKAIGDTGIKNDPASIGHHVYVVSLHCFCEVPRFARDDTSVTGRVASTLLAIKIPRPVILNGVKDLSRGD